jgi:hypothetical protein
MPANIDPIFSQAPDIQGKLVVTAPSVVYNTSGTIGTDIYAVWIADATNGGYIQKLRVKYSGNNTTTSNAAVLKIWISSVSTGTPTTSQAYLYDEIALPATGALSTTTTSAVYEIPMGIALPAGYAVLAVITVTQPANFGWFVTGIGGKY